MTWVGEPFVVTQFVQMACGSDGGRWAGEKKGVPELIEMAKLVEMEEESVNPELRLKRQAQLAPEVQRVVRLMW